MHQAAPVAPRFTALRWLVLIAGLLLGGCGSTPMAKGEFLAEVAPGRFATFAWLDDENPGQSDRDLDFAIRQAIDAELARVGQRKTPLAEADLIVSYVTEISVENVESDPFITGHVAEQVEFGTLTIELLDVSSGAAVWRGSTREKLRVSGVLFGGVTANQFSPTGDARDWDAAARVAATIAPLAGRL